MFRFMLDTNSVSYALKGNPPSVRKHLRQVPMAQVCVSSITEAELLFGLALKPQAAKLAELNAKIGPTEQKIRELAAAIKYKEPERKMIAEALRKHRGNISRAARELGLTRRGLYLKLDRYQISTESRADGAKA